jgi:hypothetical protein
MKQSTATRRLVKSPPELWAELSTLDSLGRHLAEFGDIRITRVEPETTVAWEGERASGTVELAPAGWGTKVILTATPAKASAAPAVADVPAAPPRQAIPRVEAPRQAPPRPAEAPRQAPPRPVEAPRQAPPPPEGRRGFFARLFRKRAPVSVAPETAADPSPVARRDSPEPPAAAAQRGALPAPAAGIPGPPAPGPAPSPPTPTPQPGPTPPAPDPVPPTPVPQPPPPPQIKALDCARTVAILTEVLDDLGAAHHRPFSRD